MGFGLYARRVRDVSAPLDHRFHGFKYCVEYESPLGYEGTFAYLEAATGHRREDPEVRPVEWWGFEVRRGGVT